MHQCGFTTPGRPDNRNKFTGFDIERYVIQGANLLVAETVDLADITKFDEGHEERDA